MTNIDRHREAHRAMSEDGADAAATSFGDDVTYHDHARGLTLKGKQDTTGWLREWKSAFSDARIADATYLDSGDWTIAQFQGRGRNDGQFGQFPATGRTLDAPFCELLRWDNGKVVEGGIYYDSATILIQLGHMPAPEQ